MQIKRITHERIQQNKRGGGLSLLNSMCFCVCVRVQQITHTVATVHATCTQKGFHVQEITCISFRLHACKLNQNIFSAPVLSNIKNYFCV